MALTYFGIESSEAIAIEDAKRGIDSSINAGIKTIQVKEYNILKNIDNRCIQYNNHFSTQEAFRERKFLLSNEDSENYIWKPATNSVKAMAPCQPIRLAKSHSHCPSPFILRSCTAP